MKDFKDIKEGLLRGMDDMIASGETIAQDVINKRIFQQHFAFDSVSHRKMFKENRSFIHFVNNDDHEKSFNNCCSYDGNVLTIDMTKENKDVKLRICTFNGGSDLPMIKIIDNIQTKIKAINADCCDECNVLITSGDDKPIDVESFIHHNTNISAVAYDRCGTNIRTVKTNVFPGTVRDLCAYYCKFVHINTKAWPKCKLWFPQAVVFDLFMQQIGKGNEKYELGYPARNIMI